MTRFVLLDAGPLGMAANPRGTGAFPGWFRDLTASEAVIVVPEVCDYEVRRELTLARLDLAIARLNQVRASAHFEPISSEIMLRAAEIWATARRVGRPFTGRERFDADAILIATAESLQAEGTVVIATTNVRHLAAFCDARLWGEIHTAQPGTSRP